jgi:CheY-like chemotaxis protein/anti-sigma regulatory factor (Ser/Thr protein kinase)
MTRATILAVDDDPTNLRVIGEVFRREPVTITCANSGEQALRMLSDPHNVFDVVLLDRMMGGLDGLEVLKRMKAEPRLSHTAVVLQTAASDPEQICEGISAGAHYYLTKPYAPGTLRTIVRSALEYVHDRRELETKADKLSEALLLLSEASFCLKTHAEAHRVGALVAQLCPDPKAAVLGIVELIINAVEHGNLGITCAEKSTLLREDRLVAEISRRQELPEYASRRVHVHFERTPLALFFTVRDEGQGFRFQDYLELDPARAFEPNGRGIALARMMSFSRLEYQGVGNWVIATIALPAQA